ncbi:MAG TPA: DUF488 domain-containing protein [Vicinamibacterales bacterium]
MTPQTIFTIGHSTLAIDEFVALLTRHGIRQLADVRTVPRSRRHPQFSKEALAETLAEHEIVYQHFPPLGGLRTPRSDSPNSAWQHSGFRGYADHMQRREFAQGLDALLQFASRAPTAIMCAEAVWWRCHRRLLADALLVRNVTVRHILPRGVPKPHELSEFARVDGLTLTYPGLV